MILQNKAVLIRQIAQKDAHHFTVEWSDKRRHLFRLSDLQKKCSCAHCVDEKTGRRILEDALVDENVMAKKIISVGRYALRIEFSSGCSHGIYSFDRLYDLGENE